MVLLAQLYSFLKIIRDLRHFKISTTTILGCHPIKTLMPKVTQLFWI